MAHTYNKYQKWAVTATRKEGAKGHEHTDFDYEKVSKIGEPSLIGDANVDNHNFHSHQRLTRYYLHEEPATEKETKTKKSNK